MGRQAQERRRRQRAKQEAAAACPPEAGLSEQAAALVASASASCVTRRTPLTRDVLLSHLELLEGHNQQEHWSKGPWEEDAQTTDTQLTLNRTDGRAQVVMRTVETSTCVKPSTIPGAGLGLVATRDLAAGENLVTDAFWATDFGHPAVKAKYKQLAQKVFTLHCCYNQGLPGEMDTTPVSLFAVAVQCKDRAAVEELLDWHREHAAADAQGCKLLQETVLDHAIVLTVWPLVQAESSLWSSEELACLLQLFRTFSFTLPLPTPFDCLMAWHELVWDDTLQDTDLPLFQDPRLQGHVLSRSISRVNDCADGPANAKWFCFQGLGRRLVLTMEADVAEGGEILTDYGERGRRNQGLAPL